MSREGPTFVHGGICGIDLRDVARADPKWLRSRIEEKDGRKIIYYLRIFSETTKPIHNKKTEFKKNKDC